MALYSIEGDVSGIIPDAGKNKSVISGSRVLEDEFSYGLVVTPATKVESMVCNTTLTYSILLSEASRTVPFISIFEQKHSVPYCPAAWL